MSTAVFRQNLQKVELLTYGDVPETGMEMWAGRQLSGHVLRLKMHSVGITLKHVFCNKGLLIIYLY
jgi:hypothetical protein